MLALIVGLGIAAAGSAADVWSTLRAVGVGLQESNRLLVDANGKYIVWRGVLIKALCLVNPVLAQVLLAHPGWFPVLCGAVGGGAGLYCCLKNIKTYNAWMAAKAAQRG